MTTDHFDRLLRALKDRDIAYDRSALEKAYNNPEKRPAIDIWIQEYLTPDTLLTKNEVALLVSHTSPTSCIQD